MMTTARALVGRVLRPLFKAVEGQPRSGSFHLPVTGGFLPDGAPTNWWQVGMNVMGGEPSALVSRCISLYSETVSSLPGSHWRRTPLGGRSRVTNSALSRILHRPNEYETFSAFMLGVVDSLYKDGNAYGLALRNERFEIDSLHLMNPRLSGPLVANDASIFYRLGGNAVIDKLVDAPQLVVPARDVLHVRLHNSNRHPSPLLGESPLMAALLDLALTDASLRQQLNFFNNQSRPSAVLSTDLVLDAAQAQQLRDRWSEQAKGLHAGGVPILTAGLKVQPWTVTPRDGQAAELLKMSSERICWAYGVPLQLVGLASGPASSVQALMQFWLGTGLGFCLNHVEEAFDQLFGLRGHPDEFLELDTDALLRTDFKDRIEGMARAVQSGIFSPNDARAREDLDAVPYGDEVRTQAQNVPLSAAAGLSSSAPTAAVAPSASAVKLDYQAAVTRDVEALAARSQRPQRMKAEPRAVIRKVTERPVKVTKR